MSAALIAIVNSMRKADGKALFTGVNRALYAFATTNHNNAFNDVSSGPLNGKFPSCGSECVAGPGYDYLTGLGSPKANFLIQALAVLP
jgi:hypothetical protein